MSCQIQPVAAAELQKGKGEEEEGTIEEINELSSCKFLLATPANHTVDAPNIQQHSRKWLPDEFNPERVPKTHLPPIFLAQNKYCRSSFTRQ